MEHTQYLLGRFPPGQLWSFSRVPTIFYIRFADLLHQSTCRWNLIPGTLSLLITRRSQGDLLLYRIGSVSTSRCEFQFRCRDVINVLLLEIIKINPGKIARILIIVGCVGLKVCFGNNLSLLQQFCIKYQSHFVNFIRVINANYFHEQFVFLHSKLLT